MKRKKEIRNQEKKHVYILNYMQFNGISKPCLLATENFLLFQGIIIVFFSYNRFSL